jgi:hypothetical protein
VLRRTIPGQRVAHTGLIRPDLLGVSLDGCRCTRVVTHMGYDLVRCSALMRVQAFNLIIGRALVKIPPSSLSSTQVDDEVRAPVLQAVLLDTLSPCHWSSVVDTVASTLSHWQCIAVAQLSMQGTLLSKMVCTIHMPRETNL